MQKCIGALVTASGLSVGLRSRALQQCGHLRSSSTPAQSKSILFLCIINADTWSPCCSKTRERCNPTVKTDFELLAQSTWGYVQCVFPNHRAVCFCKIFGISRLWLFICLFFYHRMLAVIIIALLKIVMFSTFTVILNARTK